MSLQRRHEARSAKALPEGPGWWFEPKWDGFRCLAFKAGDRAELLAMSGKSLNRFFPEVVDRLRDVPVDRFGLDGELLAQEKNDWSFEVLQSRLHPAESRIRRRARETPAVFAILDMLLDAPGRDLRGEPLERRRKALANFANAPGAPRLTPTPGTADRRQAQAWLNGNLLEGVVCNADLLHHVGFTSGFAGIDKVALTARLQALKGPPGFTGRAPGGPSRWATDAPSCGSRSGTRWWWRSPTTMCQMRASGTERLCCVSGRTRPRRSAARNS